MLNTLLNKFGYYNVSKLSDNDIALLFELKNNSVMKLTDEQAQEMFSALKKVPYYKEYLEFTLDNDKNRFFTCNPVEQPIVRGAWTRTRYLLAQFKSKEEDTATLKLARYS